jgi:hypothetical protein
MCPVSVGKNILPLEKLFTKNITEIGSSVLQVTYPWSREWKTLLRPTSKEFLSPSVSKKTNHARGRVTVKR